MPNPTRCACSPTTRCAAAWALRDRFLLATGPAERRELVLTYTAHCRDLGELAGRPPSTEVWPVWSATDERRPDA